MKAIIFAGGVGTRLWPLSRKSSPKQFEKVIGDKSTLQLAVERLLPDFGWKDIYIATGIRYVSTIASQLPKIPKENIIGEPEARDVGPAVGHMVKKVDLFRKIIKIAEKIIRDKKSNLVFITQKARFASQNLGWIDFGKASLMEYDGIKIYPYNGLIYRPELAQAESYLKSGHHAWNVGYFVTTPRFLWQKYKSVSPTLFEPLSTIQKAYINKEFNHVLKEIYPKLPKISFDDAILTKIKKEDAVVISENIDWSDVGAWEALKEALQTSSSQNVAQGKVLISSSKDSLIYNYTDQLVVALDLEGLMIVSTHDVILVCHKNSVPKIKKLVESLKGGENEHLM